MRNQRVLRGGLTLLILVGCSAARADFYSCKAADGRTIRGDMPPPECADREIKRFAPDGRHIGTIDPPPTAEQKAAREAEMRRKLDEEEIQLNQRRRDRSLLETYGSVEEIDATRKRAVADRQVLIERAQKRLDELKREKKRLTDETEFYAKRDLPEKLKRNLADNNEAIKGQNKIMDDTKADIRRVDEFYNSQAQRFRQLMDQGATPVQRLSDKK